MKATKIENAVKTLSLLQIPRLVLALAFAGVIAVATGCVERRVEYVPAYQTQPGYPSQPAYSYPPQSAYQAPASGTQSSSGADQPPTAAASGTNLPPQQGAALTQPSPSGTALVSQAPPPPQVQVVPVAPGPDYVWAPGYWSWNDGWVWVSGNWVIRPRLGAIWFGGHWGDAAEDISGSAVVGARLAIRGVPG